MFRWTKPQKLIYDMEKYAGGSIATICGSIIIRGKKDIGELIDAVNELYRLNDALRIRIIEIDERPFQKILEYSEQKIGVLRFENKAELDLYAAGYAKEPMDFYDSLCHIQIIVLDNAFGILVKLHHIISDAWTLALIGTQISAILKNKNSFSSYSYLDYISSEEKYLECKRYLKDKDFYIEQFEKCDEVVYLSEKQSISYVADRKTFIIDSVKTTKITEYAKENNTSLFMLFMTILGVYINRVKMNQEKFYVGTAILNRSGVQERNTMGMFVNTVPVLFELDNDLMFTENLHRISKNIMDILRHQKFNYGDVLKAIRSKYDFSGNLYDVMLSYQNAKIIGVDDTFESTWYHCGMQIESLQIHIDDRDSEGILKIHYDYQTEKFTEKEIERIHEHIFNLLFDVIDGDKRITKMNILSEKEKNLLNDFSHGKINYQENKCVHQLFEEQVVKTPDKIAVIACDKTLTYDELNRQSNRIANALIEKGISKGDIVSFALQRKSYLIAIIFGILKSGAIYMPVDAEYPQERIDYMLADSNSKAFITEDNIREYFSDNEDNPNIEMTSESYCYCIYTSGSTGRPKGTILFHKGIVNLVKALNIYGDISKIRTVGFLTAITFDVATQEILTTLLNGFTGILLPERRETEIEKIIDCIEKYKIDLIYATPSYYDVLTSEYHNAERLMRSLSTVVLAGEQFYLNSNVIQLRERYNTIFENQYGPAEVHVIATTATIQNSKTRSERDESR